MTSDYTTPRYIFHEHEGAHGILDTRVNKNNFANLDYSSESRIRNIITTLNAGSDRSVWLWETINPRYVYVYLSDLKSVHVLDNEEGLLSERVPSYKYLTSSPEESVKYIYSDPGYEWYHPEYLTKNREITMLNIDHTSIPVPEHKQKEFTYGDVTVRPAITSENSSPIEILIKGYGVQLSEDTAVDLANYILSTAGKSVVGA